MFAFCDTSSNFKVTNQYRKQNKHTKHTKHTKQNALLLLSVVK